MLDVTRKHVYNKIKGKNNLSLKKIKGVGKMNTFYNGKEITKGNLLDVIRECMEKNWRGSDLHRETEEALEKIYFGEYDGAEEDIEGILEKLNEKNRWGYLHPRANLQTVEIIISGGEWFFQQG